MAGTGEGRVSLVEIEHHPRGVVRIVMNHAEARNAMGEALRGALLERLTALQPDPECRVLVIGSALKDFSVGGDLNRMDALSDPKAGRARMQSAHRLARLLVAIDRPVIAEVRGYAMGAGAGLALIADTVVMGEGAAIGFPFARVGLAPDFLLGYTLPRRMGAARARQALLYARTFAAADALAAGLADEVVPDDQVTRRALQNAQELAALPAHALALTRQMVARSDSAEAVLDIEVMAQALCFATDDFREGVAAFREKRPPTYRGS
jgi:2-(1,2-epoxy-1,2-dihydrophenyl)acetyl-CoA isomerase